MINYNLDYHLKDGGSVESSIRALLLQATKIRSQGFQKHLIVLITLFNRH